MTRRLPSEHYRLLMSLRQSDEDVCPYPGETANRETLCPRWDACRLLWSLFVGSIPASAVRPAIILEADGFAGKGVYTLRFVSRPGERDGLHWPAPSGKDESPLSEFAAAAAKQGYSVEGRRYAPYHGYFWNSHPTRAGRAGRRDVSMKLESSSSEKS